MSAILWAVLVFWAVFIWSHFLCGDNAIWNIPAR